MTTPHEPSRINAYVPSGSHFAGAGESPETGTEPRPLNAAREPNPWARWMNIAIGAWLVISAFLLPQPNVSVINTCVVGAAVAAVAALALVLSRPAVRVANVILASWLFISTIVFTSAMGAAAWNNALAAFAVLLFALVPGSRHTNAGRPHRIARGLT